jgi:hypothetical protein
LIQVAAFLCWLTGVGFGVFIPNAIWSVATGRGVPIVFGFPAYGGGTFERIGVPTSVPLLVAFLVVCVLEVVAGVLLWNGQRNGAILALALLVPGAVLWVGFDLPFPPIIALVRTVLIVLSWSSLE